MHVSSYAESGCKIFGQGDRRTDRNGVDCRNPGDLFKKTVEYAVNPQNVLYALHGSAVHTINENHTEGNMLTEIRLRDEVTSGKFDLYGEIIDCDAGVLGDIKVTSSYKIMKALGKYKVDVPTGETYKSGLRKGQPRYKKEWHDDGCRNIGDWAIQINYYRILLQKQGLTVNKMVIQALCRDNSLRVASERGIDRAVYLIPVNPISDRWVHRYMRYKARILNHALKPVHYHLPVNPKNAGITANVSTTVRWRNAVRMVEN